MQWVVPLPGDIQLLIVVVLISSGWQVLALTLTQRRYVVNLSSTTDGVLIRKWVWLYISSAAYSDPPLYR